MEPGTFPPPRAHQRGFHQRGAGGGDSATRVLLGTVTASGTAWPWPVSHAPPRWLSWPGIQPAPLCPLGPSGHQCSCPLWSLMLLFSVSLWSPILLSPASLWSLKLLSLLSPMLLSPFIPLVTSPVTSVSLVTDASVPFYPCGHRCQCPLCASGPDVGFVPRGSASSKGTLGALGTCHQASLRARGQGRDPIPCCSIWEPRSAWSSLRQHGCSCHPVAGGSVPRGHHPPLGTAAPFGDTEHPWRAWLFAPAGTRVAPGYTQLFGGSPSL